MPVRKIPENYRNVTGVAASGKAVGPAQFESALEPDFLALLDFSTEVERYAVQPIKIEWRNEHGKPRSYTPDVFVEFIPELNRRLWLCEVKYPFYKISGWCGHSTSAACLLACLLAQKAYRSHGREDDDFRNINYQPANHASS